MTERTRFKPRITFPLCELLYYKILIEAELSVTPWFPLMSEAAVNIKAGVASLNWGQGVKLHNRLFVCGFLSLPPSSPGLTRGCERHAVSHQWPTTSHKGRQTVWWLEATASKHLPEATDATNPPTNNCTTLSFCSCKEWTVVAGPCRDWRRPRLLPSAQADAYQEHLKSDTSL